MKRTTTPTRLKLVRSSVSPRALPRSITSKTFADHGSDRTEPSVFASPPLYTSATSYKSTGPSRAGSTSYWSIHSSASSQHTRAPTASSIASTQSRISEAASPGHRRSDSALSKSRSPAKIVPQPTGLVQAIPLSPVVPLDAAWLPGPLPAQPSQLSLAHPARMVQQHQQRKSLAPPREAASASVKASAGVDLQKLRREQLARRRAVEADELNGDDSSSETASADDEAEVVAADEPPALGRASPVQERKEASSWEDEHPAGGPSRAVGAVAPAATKPGGRRSPLLLRRTSAKRGGARL